MRLDCVFLSSSLFRGVIAAAMVLVLANATCAGEEAVRLDPRRIDLSNVTDRSDLSFDESPAYYAILDHVRNVSPSRLRAAAAAFLRRQWKNSPRFHQWPIDDYPLFYDLTQRPEVYRGEPVTLRGHLVRLVKYAAGPNEFGIDTLYEGWLVTPDSQTHPTTVICTGIPPGMTIGDELIDGVSVTGYFLKLHTYTARDGQPRFAPLVLASRLDWSYAAGAPAGWPVMETAVFVGLLVLAGLIGLVVAVRLRRRRRVQQARLRELTSDAPADFFHELTP